MKVERYGDELVVRLPSELLNELQIEAGDDIELRAVGPGCIEVIRVSTEGRSDPIEDWLDSSDEKPSRGA